MPVFNRRIVEFEHLPRECGVKFGVAFSLVTEVKTFKESCPGMALKYSAFYRTTPSDPHSEHVVMLGWDHSICISRRDDGYYVDYFFAHGSSDDEPASRVYKAALDHTSVRMPVTSLESMPGGSHNCGTHGEGDCVWRKYDVRAEGIRIKKLITFSVTSCSVGCLWTKDKASGHISHMAFKAPIPLFWTFKTMNCRPEDITPSIPVAAAEGTAQSPIKITLSRPHPDLRLLASVNASKNEFLKFSGETLPFVREFDVDACLLSRGPEKCQEDGDNAPYKTHPYVDFSFDYKNSEVTISGALGYNNDPTLKEVEMPPFHSLGVPCSVFYRLSTTTADAIDGKLAQQIIDSMADLVSDNYGFGDLHRAMVDSVVGKDKADRSRWTNAYNYATPVLNALLKQQYKVPDILKGKERGVFRIAELASNPKNPTYRQTFETVLDVWKALQSEFTFPVDHFHR